MKDARLSIFSRFKTGSRRLTGEARRQRAIIAILAVQTNPTGRTRTGIARQVAEVENSVWKNVYSGIFRDLDEVLLPMHVVEEEGRMPLKRGPKALQEMGVPYYRLTREGVLVAASLVRDAEQKRRMLKTFFAAGPDEDGNAAMLKRLSEASPLFASYVVRLYVGAFCEKRIDSLLPFELSKLRRIEDDSLAIHRELLAAFARFSKGDRDGTIGLLDEMMGAGKGDGAERATGGTGDGNAESRVRKDGAERATGGTGDGDR